MIKKKYISLLFLVSSVSLIGTGFSSWVIGVAEDSVTGTIGVDTEISFVDLKNSINYIIGSESGFSYYIYNSTYYFTETSYSIDLKINPLLMETTLSYSSLTLYYGISYQTTNSNYDLFSSESLFVNAPTRAKYRLKSIPEFYLESNETISSVENKNNSYIYTMSSYITLLGGENSLCSFAKKYQKTNEDVYLTVTYDFELLSAFTSAITSYLNVDMSFYLSIRGASE